MTVDPRVGFWLSIVLAIMGYLAGASASLTDLFGSHAHAILAILGLLTGVGNSVNAVLHAIPASNTDQKTANEFYLGQGKKPT